MEGDMEHLLWRYIGIVGLIESRYETCEKIYGADKIRQEIHTEIVDKINHYREIKSLPKIEDDEVRRLINPILHNIDKCFKDAKFMMKRIEELIEF
jgi:hypothetical protein